MKELRFEIYLKSGVLPKERDVPYFQAAKLPSRLLVSVSESERIEPRQEPSAAA
jgi:hypothetical protein